MKNLSIIGSTGSIGTQTLDVVSQHPDQFKVVALVAHHNIDLLEHQIKEYKPLVAGLVDEGERGVQRLHARLERMALRVDGPVVQILFGVVLVVMHGAHTNDLSVLGVDSGEVGAVAERT